MELMNVTRRSRCGQECPHHLNTDEPRCFSAVRLMGAIKAQSLGGESYSAAMGCVRAGRLECEATACCGREGLAATVVVVVVRLVTTVLRLALICST